MLSPSRAIVFQIATLANLVEKETHRILQEVGIYLKPMDEYQYRGLQNCYRTLAVNFIQSGNFTFNFRVHPDSERFNTAKIEDHFFRTVAKILLLGNIDTETVIYTDAPYSNDVDQLYPYFVDNLKCNLINLFRDEIDRFIKIDYNPYMEYKIYYDKDSLVLIEMGDYRIRRYHEAVRDGILTE